MPDITTHVVVPIATEADARRTATQLRGYDFDQVTVVHVIEQGENMPDPVSPEQAEKEAEIAFAAFRDAIPDATTKRVYRNDVVQGIRDVAQEVEATAIAFHPRGGSRIVQFLSGDVTLRLVTEADIPVIALPEGKAQ